MPPAILYVEDNATDAELARLALEAAHVTNELVVASSGEAALAYLEQSELPLVVLVDLGLPLMDGVTLIHQMRTNTKTRPIPVMVLTGRPEDTELYSALKADAYLRKPLDVETFSSALRLHGLTLDIIRGND